MNINIDWKFSANDMPKKDDNIIVLYEELSLKPEYRTKKLVRGTFQGEDYKWEYGKGNFVYGVIAREIIFKNTLTFGREVIYDLPLTGFYWDYISLNFNLP